MNKKIFLTAMTIGCFPIFSAFSDEVLCFEAHDRGNIVDASKKLNDELKKRKDAGWDKDVEITQLSISPGAHNRSNPGVCVLIKDKK